MQLVFHAGAHFAEEERLMKCLLRNKDSLAERGVAVPGPARYRPLLRYTLNAMREGRVSEEAHEVLMDAILDVARAERVLLSNAHFFGAPRMALRRGTLYPLAPERMRHLQVLFPDATIELFLALRNPASLLPHLFAHSPREETTHFMDGVDPRLVLWSETLRKIREAAPNVPLTVWCNEDAPFVWSEVIRRMAALEAEAPVVGAFDLLSEIIDPDGFRRFEEYIASRDALTETEVRRVIAAFLSKFAIEDAVEEELDMPDWTQDLVTEMTSIYDEDVARIEAMPDITLILP
jgi:hypothetical protein